MANGLELGRVGVWTAAPGRTSAAEARAIVEEIEELGFPTLWYPESVGAKESIGLGALLLSWTKRMIVASGIANIAARDPMAMATGARMLTDEFPGRFLLGIGSSTDLSMPQRGHDYAKPYTRMVNYLDGMEAFEHQTPGPAEPVQLILAALGPRMLRLAAERSIGAHPSFTPMEHTAFAREVMGEGPILAPELPVLIAKTRDEARQVGGEHMGFYLTRRPYMENMARLGFTEDDMQGSGSDALFDSIVAWGDVDAIRARVDAHLEAGADHVCIEPLARAKSDPQMEQLRELAPALLEV